MSDKPTYEELGHRVKELELQSARLKQAQETLQKENGRSQQYLDIAGVMFVAIDAAQNVVMINQKGCEILGYEERDVVGRNWFDHFVKPEDVEQVKNAFYQILSGDIEPVEYYENPVLTKHGNERIIAWHNAAIRDASGHITGTLSSGEDITDRKRAEKELRQSEAHLQSVFRVAPTGIGVVVNRIFKQVNKRICEMTGYSQEELVGQSARMVYPSDEDYAYVGREKYDQINNHGTGMVETRWKRKDGRIIDVLLSSTPIDLDDLSKGVTFTALDITERKQAEREQDIRNKILQTFLVVSDQDMYHDVLKIVLDAFESEFGVFGYIDGKGDLVCPSMTRHVWDQCRMPGKDIVFPEDTWGDSIWGNAVRTGQSNYSNKPFPVPQGHIPIKNCLTAPLVLRGKPIGLLTVANKTAGYHEADRQLLETIAASVAPVLQAKLERKEAVAEKAKLESRLRQAHKMESIGTLAGGIAHDFNNILTPILVQTEIAKLSVAENDPVQDNLDEVMKAGYRARDLVQQILTFSRQSDQQRLPIDLVPIVQESLNLLRASIPKTIEIKKDFTDAPCTVQADPTQIQEVIMNLCTNAAQAMADMGSVLEVGLEHVEFDKDAVKGYPNIAPGSYGMLRVSDTGSGIEPAVMDKIFDPYFTTKELGVGTGMGLAVAHGIVQSHGGAITVDSEPGQGATFRVFLPRVEQDVRMETTAVASLPAGSERILFVDDEEPLVRIGEQMLGRLGYHVDSRTSSIEALAAFQDHPDQYDLVITDMTMPNMTGEALAKELLRTRPDIPIIICTGFSYHMDEHKALSMGIQAFIMKPFVMKTVAETIRKVLQK